MSTQSLFVLFVILGYAIGFHSLVFRTKKTTFQSISSSSITKTEKNFNKNFLSTPAQEPFNFANIPMKYSDEEEDDEEDDESSTPAHEITEEVSASDDVQISLLKEGIQFPTNLNGSDVRVGIIMARWNNDIIQGLYKGVNESLTSCRIKAENVFTTYVPGSFELPVTARFLAASKRVDVIICIGCLIKGDTMHFEYIADAVAHGIMQVSLESYVPCIFGVLTVFNKQQAIVRSTGTTNEGLSWGTSAVEMGLARMSALGFDQKKDAKKKEKSNNFVTFDSNSITKKNESVTPGKKFGF